METTRFLSTRYASQSSVFHVLLNFLFRLFRLRMVFLITGVINLDWPKAALHFLILMGAGSSSTSVYIFSPVPKMSLMSSQQMSVQQMSLIQCKNLNLRRENAQLSNIQFPIGCQTTFLNDMLHQEIINHLFHNFIRDGNDTGLKSQPFVLNILVNLGCFPKM